MISCENIIKMALNKGATEAEVYLWQNKSVRIEFEEEIKSFKVSDSIGLGIRVALNKKLALYSTTLISKDEIEKAVLKAIKIAKASPEDPNWNHLNKKFDKSPAEGYYDKKIEKIDYEEIVETIKAAIGKMMDYDKRVKPTRGGVSIGISKTLIANNYGESGERRETGISAWLRAKAEENGLKSTGTEHAEARAWDKIDLKELAVKAAEKAVKFLKAKPIESGEMPVIISNKIFANILGVMLSGPISAEWVQKRRSPLANKIGKEIAHEKITIIDDGIMNGGWNTRPFDDEGYPTQVTPIIEKGILKNYIYDTYTALKDKVNSTGNAYRFYGQPPMPRPNNLILKPGTASLEEIIEETKLGLYVIDTIGEWLSNPVSGNLNATVTHAHLIKNGEITQQVKGIVISGDFYKILREGMEILGKDLENSRNIYTPTVKIAKLTIAGK